MDDAEKLKLANQMCILIEQLAELPLAYEIARKTSSEAERLNMHIERSLQLEEFINRARFALGGATSFRGKQT